MPAPRRSGHRPSPPTRKGRNIKCDGSTEGNHDIWPAIEVICCDGDHTYITGNRSKNSSSKKLFPVVYYLKWNSRIIYCKLDIQILTNQRWAGPLPILIIDSNQQSRRVICGERFSCTMSTTNPE